MNERTRTAPLLAGLTLTVLATVAAIAAPPDGAELMRRRPGPPPGSFAWHGVAQEGSRRHAALMFLMPPRGERPPEGVRPERPPGELRIGQRVLYIKPGQVETAAARGSKVIRKLTADLMLPDGAGARKAGTLAIAIDPDPETGLGLLTGTATVEDPAGSAHTFALSATLPPPPPAEDAPEERPSPAR